MPRTCLCPPICLFLQLAVYQVNIYLFSHTTSHSPNFISVCLSLPIQPPDSVCPCTHLSIYPPAHPSIHLAISLLPPIYSSNHPPILLTTNLASARLSICSSSPFILPSTCLPLYLSALGSPILVSVQPSARLLPHPSFACSSTWPLTRPPGPHPPIRLPSYHPAAAIQCRAPARRRVGTCRGRQPCPQSLLTFGR